MQNTISLTIFYSLLFAMGGAPTIAMLLIQSQPYDPNLLYPIFIGLTVMVACVLVPLMLLQNGYLWWRRKDQQFAQRLDGLKYVYLWLNAGCLVFWLWYQWGL